MSENKQNDKLDQRQERQSETVALKSKDAQEIVAPTAADKQSAEANRTNQSSGSLTELTLRGRGLTREQIAAAIEEQGDSISIDYGNGQEASRKSGLTAKSMVQVSDKTYDGKAVLAYDNQGQGAVSDANSVTAPVQNQRYEQDQSKIFPKQVEHRADGVKVTARLQR